MNALARWLRNHPQVGDALLAAFVFITGTRLLRIDRSIAVALPTMVVMALALTVRRRHPVAAFATVAAAAFVQWVANIPVGGADFAVLVALYTVAAYARDRRATIAAGVVAAGGVVLAVARWHDNHPLANMIAAVAVTAVALALGDDRRNRRAYFDSLEERAERLERERDAQSAVAASAERARIARELHDVVAHSLSIMVAQADGASYAIESDPVRARRAMTTVADTGRNALTEMRRLLGVLRPTTSSADLTPQPGVHQIYELVATVRGAGLPVNLVVEGHMTELPAGLELAAYRIVQEALTNTLKHSGPGATAKVTLHYQDHQLAVHVDDDGAGIRQPGNDAAGQGLAGMRERAAMYGGTLQAGRAVSGGFTVIAQFPLHTSPV